MRPFIAVSEAAAALIDCLRAQHGALLFHLGGGCCGGNAPLCLPKGELLLDESDVHCGSVHGCAFWMSTDTFKTRQFSTLLLDITQGGGAAFSLEIPFGWRFVLRTMTVNTASGLLQ